MKNAMQLKAIMKKLAKENQISAQLVLQNYMLERFLERVSLSPYRDNYIIKGGFLISSMVGLNSRATMDMDATIKGYPVTQDTVQKMIEKILTVPVDDDITFIFKSICKSRRLPQRRAIQLPSLPTHPSCPQSAVNKPRLKQSAVAFIISQPKSKPCSPKLCGTPRNRCWRCLVRAAWCCCWRWS